MDLDLEFNYGHSKRSYMDVKSDFLENCLTENIETLTQSRCTCHLYKTVILDFSVDVQLLEQR